jgi:hypothetical protein
MLKAFNKKRAPSAWYISNSERLVSEVFEMPALGALYFDDYSAAL